MIREQRRWHAWGWLVLGPALIAAFLATLALRPRPGAAKEPAWPTGVTPTEAQPGEGER